MTTRGDKTIISNTLVGMTITGRQRRSPCLVQFSGRDLGRPYFILKQQVILGRDPRADIRIDERKVSRQHCETVLRDGAVSKATAEPISIIISSQV